MTVGNSKTQTWQEALQTDDSGFLSKHEGLFVDSSPKSSRVHILVEVLKAVLEDEVRATLKVFFIRIASRGLRIRD